MAHAGEKPTTERRIHVLPSELLERVRAYQAANNIPSEVEAVRRLLSEALQARDSLDDIMKQVRAYYRQDRDLRALARDVLTGHILVSKVEMGDYDLKFVLRNLDAGKINQKGDMEIGSSSDDGYLNFSKKWPPEEAPTSSRTKSVSSGGWDAPSDHALDDEIPF